jgi:hypothetical protein
MYKSEERKEQDRAFKQITAALKDMLATHPVTILTATQAYPVGPAEVDQPRLFHIDHVTSLS